MASQGYYDWVAAGRPLEPCQPVRDLVARLKVAYPAQANEFSWYADETHYTAEPPQDHTPYSATGWPWPSPRWVVFATDVMHRPLIGADCNVLFPYWLAEAKAGRMPWLKYMIWQAKRYDVRNNWVPVAAVGHFDHIHLSVRTDHQDTRLGAWSVVPPEDDMTPEQAGQLAELHLLATKGQRTGAVNNTKPNDNQTADGGVPIAWWPKQFFEVDNAIAAIDCGEGGDCDLSEVLLELRALRAENRALRLALSAAYAPPGVDV
jgi:hypothetical protein